VEETQPPLSTPKGICSLPRAGGPGRGVLRGGVLSSVAPNEQGRAEVRHQKSMGPLDSRHGLQCPPRAGEARSRAEDLALPEFHGVETCICNHEDQGAQRGLPKNQPYLHTVYHFTAVVAVLVYT
jgi:hypothetical protein